MAQALGFPGWDKRVPTAMPIHLGMKGEGLRVQGLRLV